MQSSQSVPVWFWLVAGLALVWNAMGVLAYLVDVNQSAEDIAKLSPSIQELYASRPAWAVAAFATAVFAGVLGCLGLLLRKAWACHLFLLSLVAVLLQNVYNLGIAKMHQHEAGNMGMLVMIIVVAIFLVWFSRWSKNKGWLN